MNFKLWSGDLFLNSQGQLPMLYLTSESIDFNTIKQMTSPPELRMKGAV